MFLYDNKPERPPPRAFLKIIIEKEKWQGRGSSSIRKVALVNVAWAQDLPTKCTLSPRKKMERH